MRRQLSISHQAESRRYPPLGKRVVVGNTGSTQAGVAVQLAVRLADEVGGKVDVVPVADSAHADALLAEAKRLRATLVVLPLGGASDPIALAEQDIALQAVHRACVPVLAVSMPVAELPRNALVAIDFSDASARAASAAMRLLAPDGTATLLHVQPTPMASDGDWSALFVRGAERRLELMQRRVAPTARGGIETSLACGDPVHEILGRAAAMRADLITIGGGSRGMLHRMLASSLTTRVVRSAPCSVLVVPEIERSSGDRPATARRHRDRD